MSRVNHASARDAVVHGFRRLSVGFTAGTYALLAPIGWASFTVLAFVWRRDPVRRARHMQRITVAAYRFLHAWLRFADIAHFDPRRTLEGLPDGPCVVIANHPTLMDITAISATLGGGCAIVKPALYRRRMLHALLVGAGHIQGPGADILSIQPMLEEAVQRLREGFRVILFPEGTRSPAGRLLPFGRTAFELACRARVPLVALTLECEPLYLSKEVPAMRPPHPTPELRLGVLSIDDPASFGADSKELRRRVEGRYRNWLTRSALAGPVRIPTTEEVSCPTISKSG